MTCLSAARAANLGAARVGVDVPGGFFQYTLLAVCAHTAVFTKACSHMESAQALSHVGLSTALEDDLRGSPARHGSRNVCAHRASKVYVL